MLLFFCGDWTQRGPWPKIWGFYTTHNDAPQSVGLPWTSDQLIAETSTWEHTTLTKDIHVHSGIRTYNLRRRAAADPRYRPRADRQMLRVTNVNYIRPRSIEDSSLIWKSVTVSSYSLALMWQRLPIRWKLIVTDWPIKAKSKTTTMHTKKEYRVRRVTASLILNLDEGDVSASRPDRFTAGIKAPNTHWTGGWVGPPDCPTVACSRYRVTPTRSTKVWHFLLLDQTVFLLADQTRKCTKRGAETTSHLPVCDEHVE